MKTTIFKIPILRQALLITAIVLSIGLAAMPVLGAEGIDSDADRILKAMSDYLDSLSAFSFHADIDNEIVNLDGQKLQLSSYTTILIERPAKLYATRKGVFADVAYIFDGKTLTLHGRNHNIFAQFEVPGTVDDAIRAVELETGLDAPGADLLLANSYATLASGVVSGVYLGTAFVNDVECHHLAFRNERVDWQIWVQVGDSPLPFKYVITTKWLTGAPQYEVRLRDWNTTPKIATDRFAFTVPAGAKKLDSIPVNEMGELNIVKEAQ